MPLYVADALDAAERQELRAHLAGGCPACAGALAEAQATFAAMPLALDPVVPSPIAKARLMQRIDQSTKASNAANDCLPDNLATRLFRILVPAAVAAGLAIVVTHAVVMKKLQPDLMRGDAAQQMLGLESRQVQELLAKLDTMKQENVKLLLARDQTIQSLQEQLAGQTHLVDMLRTPDMKVMPLGPPLNSPLQPNAVARIIADEKSQQWLLITAGMSQQPPGKTYEMWFITPDQKKFPGPTFNVDEKGMGTVVAKVPQNIGPIALAAVTDEVTGGVPQPKGEIQLVGKAQ
jgi:anti-sigma-K factor RskA